MNRQPAEQRQSPGEADEPVAVNRVETLPPDPPAVAGDIRRRRAAEIDCPSLGLRRGRDLAGGILDHHPPAAPQFVDPAAPACIAVAQHRPPGLDRAQYAVGRVLRRSPTLAEP